MKTKTLLLVDGASGTGKSDLLEYVKRSNQTSSFLIKATTRQIRDYEKKRKLSLDLRFYSNLDFDSLRLDYQYEYETHRYGFSRHGLNSLIVMYDVVFVIIRNIPLMRRIITDFPKCNVIKVYIHSDLSRIRERLIRQHYNEEEIKYRLSRIEAVYKDYVQNSSFFDEVIVNNSDKRAYHRLIDNLVNKYIS